MNTLTVHSPAVCLDPVSVDFTEEGVTYLFLNGQPGTEWRATVPVRCFPDYDNVVL